MIVDNTILSILWNWMNVSDNDVLKVKKLLLPDDDPNSISCIVITHPCITENGNVYMSWCEIEVYQYQLHLCDIVIDGITGKVTYSFEV